MDDHQFERLRKSAHAGLHFAGDAADWHQAVVRVAKLAQREGETAEAAYARVCKDDPDARAMLSMHAQASTQARTGRPREYHPNIVKRGRIEAALSDAAMKLAKARGVSYEVAFSDVLKTDAGIGLYTALRSFDRRPSE